MTRSWAVCTQGHSEPTPSLLLLLLTSPAPPTEPFCPEQLPWLPLAQPLGPGVSRVPGELQRVWAPPAAQWLRQLSRLPLAQLGCLWGTLGCLDWLVVLTG